MRFALIVVAACGGAASTPVAPAPSTGALEITADKFGPIGAKQPATLLALRQAFPGYEVRPRNEDNSLEFHVFAGKEQLLYVVTDDAGGIFNVHATSAKISVAGKPWRAGEPFSGSTSLSKCECWGENPTCFKTGEHVAVNFDRSCEGLTGDDPRALKVLDGVKVQRVIWSPTAFGEDKSESTDSDTNHDPCSGGD